MFGGVAGHAGLFSDAYDLAILEQMLLDGEVDAIIQPNVNEACAKGDPRVARLWPNYQEVETAYYRRRPH